MSLHSSMHAVKLGLGALMQALFQHTKRHIYRDQSIEKFQLSAENILFVWMTSLVTLQRWRASSRVAIGNYFGCSLLVFYCSRIWSTSERSIATITAQGRRARYVLLDLSVSHRTLGNYDRPY